MMKHETSVTRDDVYREYKNYTDTTIDALDSTVYPLGVLDDTPSDYNLDAVLDVEYDMKVLLNLLNGLPSRESRILKMYFGIGIANSLTLSDISEEFDLTRERVRMIRDSGLKRLKHRASFI